MSSPSTFRKTPSLVRVNVAHWSYGVALHWWGKYCECLNDTGYYKPADNWRVKRALSLFRYYTQVGDSLLGLTIFNIRRKVRAKTAAQLGKEVDRSKFADEFEKALIQRGNQAKRAAGFA